jgi:putative transcriptional regulator
MSEKNYSGKLLIANGAMHDDNFRRTVVLICYHDERGAYGLILNRPTNTSIGEVITEGESALIELDHTLFFGGPVETQILQIIHTESELISHTKNVFGSVYLGGEYDEINKLVREDRLNFDRMKFFVGYSGWGANQLESEMKQDAWIVANPKEEFVFNSDHDRLWSIILEEMGGYYKFMSKLPEDPSMN